MAVIDSGMGYGYKGFLHVECAHCGHTHTFCAKTEIDVYRCSECGCRTALVDMKNVYFECECGKKAMYRTNSTAKTFDIECLICGNPVDFEPAVKMKYDWFAGKKVKTTVYLPMGRPAPKARKHKKKA